MTKTVRDAIKEVQNSKQDILEGRREELKHITEKLDQEIEQVSKLREETKKMQVVPYSQQVEKLALPGPGGETTKMVSDMNKGHTHEELSILQNKGLPIPGDVFLESMEDPKYAEKIVDMVGEINKKTRT